jgi:hypothetical protein
MKANALPISKLYDTLNKAYVIPSYQRPFAWEPQKAIELLEAIFDDAMDGQPSPMTSIGTFLFCPVPTGHRYGNGTPNSKAPVTLWEVVDGQQRLTVLALIGYELNLKLKQLLSSGLNYTPPLEFEQFFQTSRSKRGAAVPLIIRDDDNFDSNPMHSDIAIMLSRFIDIPEYLEDRTRLDKVLAEVRLWVKRKLTEENFAQFCNYLIEKCQYIQVEADTQDTAFMMFEPLNSTSEPLTAFEVFRSKTVKDPRIEATFTNTEKYLGYATTKRDEVTKRSNELVFSVAQVWSGEHPRIQFYHLKKYLDNQVSNGFIESLENGASFLTELWESQDLRAPWFDEETQNCVRFLRAAKHVAPMPMLMRYFQNSPQEDVAAALKASVAFFALWRACFPTNKLPEIYRALLTKSQRDNMSRDGGRLKTIAELKSYLRKKLEDRLVITAFPGNSLEERWLEACKRNPAMYIEVKAICRLFILVEIGASLRSNLVPNDPWTNLDDIEHIHPECARTTLASVDWIGNLTFLPSTVNRSIQDMNWARKREVYALLGQHQREDPPRTNFSDGSRLPNGVTDYLGDARNPSLAHLLTLSNNTEWGEAQVEERTIRMRKACWKVMYGSWLA